MKNFSFLRQIVKFIKREKIRAHKEYNIFFHRKRQHKQYLKVFNFLIKLHGFKIEFLLIKI